jgi:hypothetical protein
LCKIHGSVKSQLKRKAPKVKKPKNLFRDNSPIALTDEPGRTIRESLLSRDDDSQTSPSNEHEHDAEVEENRQEQMTQGFTEHFKKIY